MDCCLRQHYIDLATTCHYWLPSVPSCHPIFHLIILHPCKSRHRSQVDQILEVLFSLILLQAHKDKTVEEYWRYAVFYSIWFSKCIENSKELKEWNVMFEVLQCIVHIVNWLWLSQYPAFCDICCRPSVSHLHIRCMSPFQIYIDSTRAINTTNHTWQSNISTGCCCGPGMHYQYLPEHLYCTLRSGDK